MSPELYSTYIKLKKKKIQYFALFTVLVRVQAGHSPHIQRAIEKPLMERLFTMVSVVRETYKGWWPTEGLATADTVTTSGTVGEGRGTGPQQNLWLWERGPP